MPKHEQPLLDAQQSSEQVGFTKGLSTEDAFLTVESLTEKCIEWGIPSWFVSIDLSKAFDRIDHHALVDSVSELGLPSNYVDVLKRLYANQIGTIDREADFRISRGAR